MIFGRTLVSIFILNEFGLLIIIYLRSTTARHVYFNSSFFLLNVLVSLNIIIIISFYL